MSSPFRLNPQPKTVLVICEQCDLFYQEIDYVAHGKTDNPEIPLLCIKCDPWSLLAACVDITAKGARECA